MPAEEDDVRVVCVIKFEFELELLLHRIVYTESTLLSFSNSGIKSSSSESDVSSNHDFTGTWNRKKSLAFLSSLGITGAYRVLRMKDVARWAVVNNYYFLQVPAQFVQILHVVATVINARLSE